MRISDQFRTALLSPSYDQLRRHPCPQNSIRCLSSASIVLCLVQILLLRGVVCFLHVQLVQQGLDEQLAQDQ